MKLIDIGANLLDSMYQGVYNDKSYHQPDLEAVLDRGWGSGESGLAAGLEAGMAGWPC